MRADAIAKAQFIVGRPRLLPENIRNQDGRPSAPQSWMRCKELTRAARRAPDRYRAFHFLAAGEP